MTNFIRNCCENFGFKKRNKQPNISVHDNDVLLKRYSTKVDHKIVSTVEDLPKNSVLIGKLTKWFIDETNCTVAAFDNGIILTSVPGSFWVQNCKSLMLAEGISPNRVLPAKKELIQMILDAYTATGVGKFASTEITTQQQRLRLLVKEAMNEDVTDIHIEVRSEVAKIRFRKNGELYLYAEWTPAIAREVVSVCFNKETDYSVTHFNPLVPQNASMPLIIDKQKIRLRLASMPAYGGFDAVFRVLTTKEEELNASSVVTLEDLGYTEEQTRLIKRACARPHGAIIIAGPTGSGKTTTLASCLSLFDQATKIYTIEDPVEKIVPNATQIPVNDEQEDRTFASLARATLRMDPDVIVLGEMRDVETASVMVRASITGHLVFSTLHTNTAPGVITRLLDMGISPALLSDSNTLICLICQRLVPVLCPHCAVPILNSSCSKDDLSRLQKIFPDLSKVKVRGQYCPICNNSGISGRTVVAEIVWIDEECRTYIKNSDTIGLERYLRSCNWQSYASHALSLVKKGVCDPFDIERIIGGIDLDSYGLNVSK